MSIQIAPAQKEIQACHPVITIIGAGGAGGNAVNNMVQNHVAGVEFIACNTDAQALNLCQAPTRIQIGSETTKGLGAGSDPEIGRQAAKESIESIKRHLQKTQMLFITAGMGGGTGTGAAPVIAELSKEMGILTIAIVTRPFDFEGHRRMDVAEKGIEKLSDKVDTLIIVPNQKLFKITDKTTTFPEAFKMADDVLCSGVRGISDLMTMPGVINLDFADIRNMMKIRGKAMIGTGEAEGKERVKDAASKAILNPLLDDGLSIRSAHGMLVNIIGGPDLTLNEVEEAVNHIRSATQADRDLPLTFGTSLHENMLGKIRISILATGIDRVIEDDYNISAIIDKKMEQPETIINTQKTTPLLPGPVKNTEAMPKNHEVAFDAEPDQEQSPLTFIKTHTPSHPPLQSLGGVAKDQTFIDKVLKKARGYSPAQAQTKTMEMFEPYSDEENQPSPPSSEEKIRIESIPSFLSNQDN